MESTQEDPKIFEQFESEEEYQKRCEELKSNGFEECNTHSTFSDEEIDKALQRMIEESIETKRVMIALRHENKLTVWIESPLFTSTKITEALNDGFRMSTILPTSHRDSIINLLRIKGNREGTDYQIIPIGDKLTIWMKSVFTKTRIDLHTEILKVIGNMKKASPSA